MSTSTKNPITFQMPAGNVNVTALFEQVPASYVTFNESGLPSGVQWTVTVGGTPYGANSGQPINVPCSSGQTISYTVNMVEDANMCFYYPNGQASVSGTASCGATVSVTYQFEGCYYGGD